MTKIAIGKNEDFFYKNATANKEKGKKEGQLKHIFLGKKLRIKIIIILIILIN
jgi:hypothetical protein